MALEYCADTTPAAWIEQADTPWPQLVGFGPSGFEAYARLRYIPDPERPNQSESDIDLPDDHPSDCDQAAAALRVLTTFTGTPGEMYFCLWDASHPTSTLTGPASEQRQRPSRRS